MKHLEFEINKIKEIRSVVFALILFFVAVLGNASSNARSITINGGIPWVVSETDYEKMPILKAIRYTERDWYKVFG